MVRGGRRQGAGRPLGSIKYPEARQLIRVPASRVEEVFAYLASEKVYHIPLYSSTVRAGFPSPADDYIERYLDLNERYIAHPHATFFGFVAKK